MYLKRIDIQGFKSFGDRSFIDFSPGITAIVGPNGSGKSNVADAVRWVLGEQSARALRGIRMEDVIFSGTGIRKPLGYAEVVLTFNNEDGTLPLAYSEVAVSRRLYRSGESEYAINRSPVRMRDIVAAFYDTGVGREGYSIIGQGKIEEILSPKGEERRAAFEEAAGVMKYKVRKLEAERKLNQVESGMVRVADIMDELESVVEPLREQSEATREFLALRTRLRTVDLTLFVEQYDRVTVRIQSICQEYAQLEEEEAEGIKRDEGYKKEEELEQEKLSVVEGLLEQAQEKRLAFTGNRGQIQSRKEVLIERQDSAATNVLRIQREYQQNKELLYGIKEALAALPLGEEENLSQRRQEVERLEKEREILRQTIEETEYRLDQKKQAQLDATVSEGERKSRLARQQAIAEQAQMQKGRIEESIFVLRTQEKTLLQEKGAMQQEKEALSKKREELLVQLSKKEQDIAAITRRLETCVSAIQSWEGKGAEARHRTAIQKDLKRTMEGYAQSVRRLMQDVREGKISPADGIYGAVGELIHTQAGYETAIGQALSGQAQHIVIQEESIGKRLIAHLREKDYGRATFLPLSALQPRRFGKEIDGYRGRQGVVGPALELVTFDAVLEPAAAYLLGRTLIVEDMDTAIAISRAERYRFRCVTLAGDILNPGGTMTGGSNRERGFLGRDRLIREGEAAEKEAQENIVLLSTKREEMAAQRESLLREQRGCQQEAQRMEVELAQSEEKWDAIVFQLERTVEEALRFETEKERLSSAMLAAQVPEETEWTDLTVLIQEIEELTGILSGHRAQLDRVEETLVSQKLALTARESERTTRQQEEKRLIQEETRLEQAVGEGEKGLCEWKKIASACVEELSSIEQEAAEIKQRMEENERAIQRLQEERQRIETRHRDILKEREHLHERINENRERRYRLGNQRERLNADLAHLSSRLWNDYQATYTQAKEGREDGLRYQAATQEALSIRTRLGEMGDVNPNAMEEYQRVFERLTFLRTQSEDLMQAKTDLLSLIGDLMQTMQERFVSQFHRINENFQKTFRALFKGGEAELVLTDEKDAMDCEIEIVAQPPGKRLQTISLLSGGERALTAIAILFAMLDLKATPFCILDEIEAALDEENLRLFSDYLKTYADRTQFIAITHRRPTMEVADTLYGVTMEERGVSKLVSVRFSDL